MTRIRWNVVGNRTLLVFLGLALGVTGFAQDTEIQMNAMYECPGDARFKVFSCSGTGDAAPCEVESSMRGQLAQRGQAPRQQIRMLIPVCKVQGAGAQIAPKAAGATASGPDANGFKIGDEVLAATAGGMYVARTVQANGDRYLVRFNEAAAVWKTYPTELRRIGAFNEADRARGLFALGEKVPVNVDGKWLQGEIEAEMGMEYQVKLPNNRSVWAAANHMQRVAAAEKPLPSEGTPPKPGMKSCAGRIEGRYAPTTAGVAGLQITFRSGKAYIWELSGGKKNWNAG